MEEINDTVSRLYGRAKFCYDIGEIKSHDLFKEAAREIEFFKEELENQEDLNDMYREENEQLRNALLKIKQESNEYHIRVWANQALQEKDNTNERG